MLKRTRIASIVLMQFCVLVCIALLHGDVALGQDEGVPLGPPKVLANNIDARANLETLLAQYESSMARVETAQLWAKEYRQFVPAGETPNVSPIAEYSCWYDRKTTRLRCDVLSKNSAGVENKVQRIWSADSLTEALGPGGPVSVSPLPNRSQALTKDVLDFRGLGISQAGDFISRIQMSDRLNYLRNDKSLMVLSCEQEESGLTKAVVRSVMSTGNVLHDSEIIESFYFDPNLENLPVRLTFEYRPLHDGGSPVEGSADLQWMEVDGVLVPSHYSGSQGETVVSVVLNWVSVNQPINEELFHYSSFDAAPGTIVLDGTLSAEKAIIVDQIEQPNSDDTLSQTNSDHDVQRDAGVKRHWMWGVFVVNVLLLAGVMCMVFKNRIFGAK